jgi:NAD(P)H-hydrate epimerase
MTAPALPCAEVRAREQRAIRELGMPSLLLMENAGRNVAELLLSLGVAGEVVICCGKGNNGGDGLVMARHLDNRAIPVRVLLFARPEELSPDAAVNYRILAGSGLTPEVHATAPGEDAFAGADWIVDALFGTGLSGPLRPPFDAVVGRINESGAKVLAVDIPSGLDGDTGRPLGPTARANHTATLLAMKVGFLNEAAREWTGAVHLIDIGLPRRFL